MFNVYRVKCIPMYIYIYIYIYTYNSHCNTTIGSHTSMFVITVTL